MDNFEKPLECCRCMRKKYKNNLCKIHYEHFLNKFGEDYFDSPKKYHKKSSITNKSKKKIEKLSYREDISLICSECNAYAFKDGLCSFHYRFANGLICIKCYSKLYKDGLCLKCYNKGNG